MYMSEANEIVYVTYIKTTPEQLWSALTDEAFTRQYWFGARIESSWEAGAPVTFWFPVPQAEAEKRGMQRNDAGEALSDTGEVLIHQPFERLSYTFKSHWDAAMAADPASRVTYSLEPGAGYVKLTVTHDRIPNRTLLIEDYKQGWPAILSNLKSLLETGSAMTIGAAPPEQP
jgi:uncharacterized protein YndB with AHSA1/START domain